MEYNRESRNKLIHLWSVSLWQEQDYIMGKGSVFSISGAVNTGQTHVKQWDYNISLNPQAIYKNKLKTD